MVFPNDEFLTKQQDSDIRARQKEISVRIQKLLRDNGSLENNAEFNSGRISESWEIMMRICRYIENLADNGTLYDKSGDRAIAFSPEASAEITHLEANLEALKVSVSAVGDLAEKAASNHRL